MIHRMRVRVGLGVGVASAVGFFLGACSSSTPSTTTSTPSTTDSGVPGRDSGAVTATDGSSAGDDSGSGTGVDSGATSPDSGATARPDSGTSANGTSDSGTSALDASSTPDASSGPDASLFDPTEVARVGGWLSTTTSGLEGYAYTNINMNFPIGPARDRLVDSIVGACAAFAPRMASWPEYCEAILTSEIVSESSYVPTEISNDAYATQDGSNDPTVGLLQIRFSSTVHDYNYNGPLSVIEAIGCAWPASLPSQADTTTFWRTQGGVQANIAFMEDAACNVPLAAWYVFMNATGNGGATAIYAADYCAGKGVAGNVVDGLLSHLDGPGYPRPADPTNAYPAGIKTRFAKLVGGLPSPDPFGVTLSPSISQFCR